MKNEIISYKNLKKAELHKYVISHAILKQIYESNKKFEICEILNTGCSIGTLGFDEINIPSLLKLLKSFEEQYGEIIDYEAAKEELMLYQNEGKLFILFDENMVPRAMNGCIYNYENESVDFAFTDSDIVPSNVYFYGLSTEKSHRGKGYCKILIDYVIEFAKENNFDLVYARTDLNNSNSEGLMKRSDMEICTYNDEVIAEWVQVTDEYGDPRLHMWVPLKDNLVTLPKENAIMATEIILDNDKVYRQLNNKPEDVKVYKKK